MICYYVYMNKQSYITPCVTSISTGLVQTFIYHPVDLVLHRYMTYGESLFHRSTYRSPYSGFVPSCFQKTISNSVYFLYQDLFHPILPNKLHLGLLIGTLNSVTLAPFNALKFFHWHYSDINSIIPKSRVRHLYQFGGPSIFFRGLPPSLARDVVFSCIYESHRSQSPLHNVGVVMFASLASSPFNYLRNHRCSQILHHHPDTYKTIISHFLHDLRTSEHPLCFIQRKFCLGLGTVRIGLGVASGQYFYDFFQHLYSSMY